MLMIFLMTILVPTVCLAADAMMVNHVMAEKIECSPGKGCFITGSTSILFEVPAGSTSSNLKFTTLDQVLFMPGTYTVEQKIIEDVTGRVVAAGKHNIGTVKSNQEIRHLTTDWNVVVKMGMYTYQIVVNNEVIATFRIRVITAK